MPRQRRRRYTGRMPRPRMQASSPRRRIGTAVLPALQAAAPEAMAQRGPAPNPDATVEIEEVRIGVPVLGGTFGGGRLHYRGRNYAP